MTVLDRITGLTDSNSRGAVFPEKWVPQILEVQQAQEAFNRCFLRLRRTDSRIGVTHCGGTNRGSPQFLRRYGFRIPFLLLVWSVASIGWIPFYIANCRFIFTSQLLMTYCASTYGSTRPQSSSETSSET